MPLAETPVAAPVLVIKLGALGDVLLALGPLAAIRRHHRDARITALTTRPYAGLIERSGLVDAVWVDDKPNWWQPVRAWRMRRRLRQAGFGRVYDLQNNDRTAFYFALLTFGAGPAPAWSGSVRGASLRWVDPEAPRRHAFDRAALQLAHAGIPETPPPDLGWMQAGIARFGLAAPFVLLVPGSAPSRPEKRWPPDQYSTLAGRLLERGLTPVLIGTPAEAATTASIAAACPGARDLTGLTALDDLAALARAAAGAVGNDTGPMHLIALTGCPVVSLFSGVSDPARNRPLGSAVTVLRRDRLADLPVDEVMAAVTAWKDQAN